MQNWPLTIALILPATFAFGYAVLMALATFENRRFARSCQHAPLSGVLPSQRIALIIPCKGEEINLAENLRHLFLQDHPNYSAFFVVESEKDPAVSTIQRLRGEYQQVPSQLVVAGHTINCGQKNHNLIQAIDGLDKKFNVMAFVDSDARPESDWLRSLVFGLDKPKVGATTGYRWMVPLRNSLPNLIVYAINSAAMALTGPGKHMLIWGGSWAIRREIYDAVGLRSAWMSTLCEDLVTTRALRSSGLGTSFSPRCVVKNEFDMNWSQAWEFLHRQFLLGRRYTVDLWMLALVSLGFFQLGLWGSLAVGTYLLATGDVIGWWGLAVFTFIYGLSCFRHWLRQDRGRTRFPDQWPRLRTAGAFDILLGPLTGLAHLIVLIGSAFYSSTRWRGIRYFLGPGGRVTFVGRMVKEVSIRQEEPETVPMPTRRAA